MDERDRLGHFYGISTGIAESKRSEPKARRPAAHKGKKLLETPLVETCEKFRMTNQNEW